MLRFKDKRFICGFVAIICLVLSFCMLNDSGLAKSTSGKCKTKELYLFPGKEYKTKYKKEYKYSSSKPKIASVSRKGKIKAHKNGVCVVKVSRHKKCIAKYKVVVARPVGYYGTNFISGSTNMTLEKIEPVNDSSFYLYFNIDEWDNGDYKSDGCNYLKIAIDKINDKGSFKDMKYNVGQKYCVKLFGNYITDGDCLLYSEKRGWIGITEEWPAAATATPAAAPTAGPTSAPCVREDKIAAWTDAVIEKIDEEIWLKADFDDKSLYILGGTKGLPIYKNNCLINIENLKEGDRLKIGYSSVLEIAPAIICAEIIYVE